MRTANKKKMKLQTKLFILFCIGLPVIDWVVFYIYPNLSAFVMAFTDRTGAFTLEHFGRFFERLLSWNDELTVVLKNTIITWVIGTLMFPFQVLISYFIYKKVPGASVFRIIFFLPGLIFSVAFAMVFIRLIGPEGPIAQAVAQMDGLDYIPELLTETRYANKVILAQYIWLCIPGNLIIWGGAFARIPEEVLESGYIDGTTWWTEFTRIIVPMMWPTVALQMVLQACAIFSASGQVFLLTGGDYGTHTITSWMYVTVLNGTGNFETTNAYNYMAAVGMCLSIVAVTISLIVRKFTDNVIEEVEY